MWPEIRTCSGYVPGQTLIVSFGPEAFTAAWIVVKVACGQSPSRGVLSTQSVCPDEGGSGGSLTVLSISDRDSANAGDRRIQIADRRVGRRQQRGRHDFRRIDLRVGILLPGGVGRCAANGAKQDQKNARQPKRSTLAGEQGYSQVHICLSPSAEFASKKPMRRRRSQFPALIRFCSLYRSGSSTFGAAHLADAASVLPPFKR